MSIVRTHQFYNGPFDDPGLFTLIYEVPSGFRALVKFVSYETDSATPDQLALVLEQDTGQYAPIFREVMVSNNNARQLTNLYAVIDEGGKLYAYAGSSMDAPSYLHVGGVLFEL